MQRAESRGLVLRSIDYKQRQRIITVLTEDRGVISLIVKGMSKKRSELFSLTSPFTVGEFHYTIHRSDLYLLHDASLIASNLDLRNRLESLEAAGEICTALLSSQMPGKPAPLLFHLATTFLKQIPLFEDPSPLVVSFLLKLLKHEGVLSGDPACVHCGLSATHLFSGEPLCSAHAPYSAKQLNEEQWQQFYALLDVRDFTSLRKLAVDRSFCLMIKRYIKDCERGDSNPQEVTLTTTSR